MLTKVKQFVEEYSDELFLTVIIGLVAVIGFGLGRLSTPDSVSSELRIDSTPVKIDRVVQAMEQSAVAKEGSGGPIQIVGNKQSKIYHRSDCAGAKNMSEANKIFFASITAAKSAGYRPAGNCPGLE